MTTAHRPTYHAAAGEASDYGNWSSGGKVSGQFSSKDLPGHTKLKFRQAEQLPDFVTRDKVETAESEAAEVKRKSEQRAVLDNGPAASEVLKSAQPLLLMDKEVDTERIRKKYDDEDDQDDDSDLDSSSDEDDDDDEELLQRELERIKAEREEARLKREADEAALRAKEGEEAALTSNPLMNGNRSSQVKRKWNDDVVFKNQARSEPEIKKRFVNDTIRNDFHRRFLHKYIQ